MASAEIPCPEPVRLPGSAMALLALVNVMPESHLWMKTQTLVDRLGYKRRTIQQAIRRLMSHDLVVRVLSANRRDLYGVQGRTDPRLSTRFPAPSLRTLPNGGVERLSEENVVDTGPPTQEPDTGAAAASLPEPDPEPSLSPAEEIAALEALIASEWMPPGVRAINQKKLDRLRSGVPAATAAAPPPRASHYADQPSRTPRKAERRSGDPKAIAAATRSAFTQGSLVKLLGQLPGSSREFVDRLADEFCRLWDDGHSRRMYCKLFGMVSRGRLAVAVPIEAWEAAASGTDKREPRKVFTSLVSKGVKTTAVR